MINNWEIKQLGDLVTFQRGFDLPKKNRIPGQYNIISSSGINGNHNKFKIKGPGLTIGRSGNIGVPHFEQNDFWPLNTTLFAKNIVNTDIFFLYYLLKNLNLSRFNAGSAVPTLNRNHIHPLIINVPKNLFEQTAIGKILSSFDQKIKLNHKMNNTLEKIAQAIFKSWFIDFEPFKDPEHELYVGEDGFHYNEELQKHIPKNIKITTIQQQLITVLGGTPARNNVTYWGGDIPWIKSGKVNEFRIIEPTEFITDLGLKKSATKIMPTGTILIAITGIVGRISILEIDACANQSVVGVIPNAKYSSNFLYFWIEHRMTNLLTKQTGSVQQHINKNDINTELLIDFKQDILNKFNELVSPLMKKIRVNCFENQNLIKIRDFLLPQLISGKIRISNPEKFLEELNNDI